METQDKNTPTELLKHANDLKSEHEKIKKEIIDKTYEIENLEKEINEKLNKLKYIENNYVKIIEEIDKK